LFEPQITHLANGDPAESGLLVTIRA
jgi:hypothetical protein